MGKRVMKPGFRIAKKHDYIFLSHIPSVYAVINKFDSFEEGKDNIFIFRDSHLILAEGQKTILIHHEHGIVEIPERYCNLEMYTFGHAFD